MGQAEAITDLKQLGDWLRVVDVRVSYAIAARSSLRSLLAPAALFEQTGELRGKGTLLLACLRATLVAGVASTCPVGELKRVRRAADAARASVTGAVLVTNVVQATDEARAAVRATAFAAAATAFAADAAHAAGRATSLAAFAVGQTNAFNSSTFKDLDYGAYDMFWNPLWSGEGGAAVLIEVWRRFRSKTGSTSAWAFWKDWYQGMLDGKPLDWDVQLKIALIDDAIWDAGPEAVAREIERIRREMAGPAPLEREKLLTHVKHLLANPVMTESAALSAADTVERAIRAYKDEAPANCLPEGLEHLEDLSGHFRAIAKVIGSASASKDREEDLRREIESLHAKVVKLEQDLVEARSKALKGVISIKAAEKLGTTLGNPVFYGGIAMGVGYFFGVTPSDMTFENLRGFIQELTSANAEAPVAPAQGLPHVHDI